MRPIPQRGAPSEGKLAGLSPFSGRYARPAMGSAPRRGSRQMLSSRGRARSRMMSHRRLPSSFIPPPSNDLSPSVFKMIICFAMVLAVMAGVIVLIISGHLTPAIAIGTVSAACYVGTEVARRLLGRPPTQLGSAIETSARAFFGSLSSGGGPSPDSPEIAQHLSSLSQSEEEIRNAAP